MPFLPISDGEGDREAVEGLVPRYAGLAACGHSPSTRLRMVPSPPLRGREDGMDGPSRATPSTHPIRSAAIADHPSLREQSKDDPSGNDLARDRTDLAEDRTVLANERTYAGWTRTAFAALALGLGFNALFGTVEPAWVARAIATGFVLLGIWIQWQARAKACATLATLDSHLVAAHGTRSYTVLQWSLTAGGAALIVAIWFLV